VPARLVHQLVLQVDRLADPRLARLEALGDDGFGDLRRAGLVERPGLLGPAGFDHHDGDVVTSQAPGHDDLERRLLGLGIGRVRDPVAIASVGEAHGADGSFERETREIQKKMKKD